MAPDYLRRFRTLLWLSLALYLAACLLPATKWWGNTNMGGGGIDHYVSYPGIGCLIFGWFFLIEVVELCKMGQLSHLAWLANPVAMIAALLLVFRRPTGAAVFGTASVVIAALYMIHPPSRPIYPGGEPSYPDLPQIGAWLWLGSLLAVTAAALLRRRLSEVNKKVATPGTASQP